MSTIVEASVPADQFALQETLERIPSVEFHMARLVAHGAGQEMPFLWAEHDDRDRLYDALESDPSTDDVDVLAEFEDECLLQIEWRGNVQVLSHIIATENATVLNASGRDGSWQLQLLFPDHDSISTTYEFCDEYGIDVRFDRIYQLSDTCQRGQFGLTEDQYETILNAYEAGYYDVPRQVSQEELATYFDVSHQALSERLRRGHETVIANALYHQLQRQERSVAPPRRQERTSNS